MTPTEYRAAVKAYRVAKERFDAAAAIWKAADVAHNAACERFDAGTEDGFAEADVVWNGAYQIFRLAGQQWKVEQAAFNDAKNLALAAFANTP